MTYYAIDRSSAAVANWGHPQIIAFTVQAALVCLLWYGMSLADALSGGVV